VSAVQSASRASDYIPALDGLRAISIGLVVLSHFGFRPVPGIFGVTIFFFISGFLITGQLLSELNRRDSIVLGLFYVRRALRLFPALLVMVAVSVVVFPLLGGHVTGFDVAGALLYLVNYWPLLTGSDFDVGTPHGIHPFAVLWSLAVEEHYYLIFPMLCLCFGRRALRLACVIAALIVLVTVWRLHVAASCVAWGCQPLWVEHATDTRVDSILYGALLATLLASPARAATFAAISGMPAFLVGVALLLASLVIRDPWFRDTWRFSIQGIGLFLGVGAVLFGPMLGGCRAVLSSRVMLLLGRWSYSLYLWHWVVKCVASIALPPWAWEPIGNPGIPPMWWLPTVFVPLVAVSLALSAASYYGVERPMIRLRRQFGSHAVADGGGRMAVPVESQPAPGFP
jgi:peptidoglycan/LPS O-acetylase OafA/YrhL